MPQSTEEVRQSGTPGRNGVWIVQNLPETGLVQTANAAPWQQRHRGFTIVELLVVMAIIGILVGLLIPVLQSAKSGGRQTLELSAARQLMAGYSNYAAINKDSVLPGYADWIPNDPSYPGAHLLHAYDATGKEITGGQLDIARKRYLWRLAPYLKYNLRGLYTNENEELLGQLEQQDYVSYLYKATISPSLGLNTEWMGGDSSVYGFLPPESPLRNALDFNHFYVSAMSQVLKPGTLLVFASARGVDPDNPNTYVEGYFKVSSPYLAEPGGYRWSATFHPGDPPVQYGYLSPRYDGKAVIGFADGHAGMLTQDQLKDMRHWANWATKADWKLPKLTP